MQSGSAPIGFEGLFSEQRKTSVGFERFETEEKDSMPPAYPLNDSMPMPLQPLYSSFASPNNSSFPHKAISSPSHLTKQDIHSHAPIGKSISYPQLFAIYNEIINEWFTEQWLTFSDNHTETYLTFNSDINEVLTVQMAIDQHRFSSGSTLLVAQPECLLIRTKSRTKSLLLPTPTISLDDLYDIDIAQSSFRYKLMAIICHSNETNSKQMFYRDFQSKSWYIYYDQSISSPSYSHKLTDGEQRQLESFIQQKDPVDSFSLSDPISVLYNHPIIYIYVPKKSNGKH